MYIQQYIIHLTNGDKIITSEPLDIAKPDKLIENYRKADPDTMFCVEDSVEGIHYFKGKDIVQIRYAGIRNVNDDDRGDVMTVPESGDGKTVRCGKRKE